MHSKLMEEYIKDVKDAGFIPPSFGEELPELVLPLPQSKDGLRRWLLVFVTSDSEHEAYVGVWWGKDYSACPEMEGTLDECVDFAMRYVHNER
jgi:hypothetical protein